MEDVGRVLSHPQALAQCRHWLEENLADVPLVDASSTAMAARQASEDPGIAAIASEIAASLYGLRIIKSKIQDNTNNLTRFLVVGRTLSPRTGQDKTSVMFIVADQPGILCRMLEPFSRRNINLTKIESRPIKSKAWEYVFFLDLEGHAEDAAVSEALADLQSCCRSFKILGSYPRCR
jgi:chorismate mutase/prephenate dehydratase